MTEKQNIRTFDLNELKGVMTELSEKPFRAKQVFEWLWQKDASSFEEMTSLSISLREKLEANYYIDHIELKDQQRYTYLRISDEKYPRLLVSRRTRDGKFLGKGKTFGPFTQGSSKLLTI